MADSAQEAYFRRRSLAMLFDNANWGLVTFGHAFVAFTLAWIIAEDRGYPATITWATLLSLAVGAQATYANKHKRAVEQLNAAGVDAQLKWFTTSAFAVGALWASAGVVLYPVYQDELRLFVVFVMGGMSLAAVGTQHVYLPVCFASMSYAIPVLAIRYAIDGHYIEPVLLLLYTAVLIRLARMLAQFSKRAVQLQFERDTLLEQLTIRADELEVAKQDAEEANAAKSRFLAQASHDLRQPLHAIGLFIETIATDGLSSRAAKVVDRVQHSLSDLSRLFDSLLDVNQLDTRTTKVAHTDFRLADLLAQLERDFRPIATESGVQLFFARTSVTVNTDPVLLRRLLQNLISNAIRYAPDAQVLVGIRRRGEANCAVQVIDRGLGISSADQKRIFQEFVRLDNPHASMTTPGLGLGLSIVRRLADLLGLRIDLASSLNRGSTFSVEGLRISTMPAQELVDEQLPETANLLQNASVLVIDDDVEVLEATCNLLRKWGCNVHARETVQSSYDGVDIIVSDVELTKHDGDGSTENGLEHLSKLKKQQPARGYILISGNTSQELRSLAQAANIPLLHKPVRPVQLRSALLHALSRSTKH